ncbi:MAG TPA: FAD-dependent oxidoreductase, partial [Chlamydiales bacterium]|nr:FAD-dependent oxidoreductase [Chlamydiales bacterium]
MLKYAIVGAGFAGLSVCWHLLQTGDCEVTIFDPLGVGGGASGISTGLLHPFPGRLSLRSWLAEEGMAASEQLLQIAEDELQRPVALRNGVLRIALEAAQKRAFGSRAAEDSEAIWVENVQDFVPLAIEAPGLWIPSGITVFSKLYLEGLWAACTRKGALFNQTKIDGLSQLDAYDGVVLCAGSEILHFPECGHLPLEPLKGQTLL